MLVHPVELQFLGQLMLIVWEEGKRLLNLVAVKILFGGEAGPENQGGGASWPWRHKFKTQNE